MIEIPKAYEPQSVEDKWYDFWLKQSCFTANAQSAKPAYSIVIPPPNVTGVLHMGHVLNNTIQDILARKARMDGKEVLWLPGTDHAGIATEGMVAKKIWKEEKKSKRDLGREGFLKRVWEWKDTHGGIIIAQLKKLGCSCDWTRERFTMDPDYVRNVQRVFVDLYKKGLIYRGKRMVNWCPATQTALSDEEVEMKPQKGFMYHFKVQVAEVVGQASRLSGEVSNLAAQLDRRDACPTTEVRLTDTWLTIATTRPETIPGDTAVAVNPKDTRYAHLIGKHIVRPLPHELPREKKLIPIIGDEHVDFEFGTGVLKVTPAHDKADFDIGQRHKLPVVDIMNPDGSMNELAGADLKGLDRFKARKVAEEKLTELGALVETKPYENNVGFSQRADVPIEPRLSEQWFLKYPSVEKSKACVEQEINPGGTGDSPVADGNLPSGPAGRLPAGTGQWPVPLKQKMRFHPQRWAKVYDHWLTNIQDWCISRQLWWGHRVPVWTKEAAYFKEACAELSALEVEGFDLSSIQANNLETGAKWKAEEMLDREDEVSEAIVGRFHIKVCGLFSQKESELLERNLGFTQDPDVLDTWFSSWLWPFATMGWPEQTETLKKFYPTTDLVTAPEIIFFWVARMIMAGFEYMGELPFRNVYFTGIVRDKIGRKMSKTLGNSPDPLDLIAKYGADAIRFGTMRSAPLGQDVMFDEKDVELGRNFCNKLWNACRFRQMQSSGTGVSPVQCAVQSKSKQTAGTTVPLPEGFDFEAEINPALLTSDDKWILLRLDQAIREVSDALATYNFNTAVQVLYRFFWSEYCDWYVEASKAALGNAEGGTRNAEQAALRANKLAVIDFVLGHTLRLFHPFLPFITEELWHGMGFNRDLPAECGGKTIMFATWPKPFSDEEKNHFGLDDAADKIAAAKYELVSLGRSLRRELKLDPAKKLKFLIKPAGELAPAEIEVLRLLLNAETIEVVAKSWTPAKGTPSAANSLGELFLPLTGLIDFAAERTRLTKELEKIRAEIAKVQEKLGNPNFAQKVPAKVLEEHQQRLADWQTKAQQTEQSLTNSPEA